MHSPTHLGPSLKSPQSTPGMISFIFCQKKVSLPIPSEIEVAGSDQMRLRGAGCLSPNNAAPARNRQSALPLDSPTSRQDKCSSRIPRGRVHMEGSSLGVNHGGDTRAHTHTHTCTHTHTRKTSSLHRPTCCLLLPTGFGLCSWRKVHSD